jgi:SAM-dependent methyltransferase
LSDQQLVKRKNKSLPHDKVTYWVEKAEHSSLASNSADLLTIANALHWFDFDVFYEEARRVLKPGGVIAAWAYGVPTISPEIDLIVNHLHDVTLHDYWVAENRLVEQGYTTIPFPFEPISCPDFVYQKPMNLHNLIAYLNTWSATQRFMEQHHFNPADQLFDTLSEVWVDAKEGKVVTWRLVLKAGRVN